MIMKNRFIGLHALMVFLAFSPVLSYSSSNCPQIAPEATPEKSAESGSQIRPYKSWQALFIQEFKDRLGLSDYLKIRNKLWKKELVDLKILRWESQWSQGDRDIAINFSEVKAEIISFREFWDSLG